MQKQGTWLVKRVVLDQMWASILSINLVPQAYSNISSHNCARAIPNIILSQLDTASRMLHRASCQPLHHQPSTLFNSCAADFLRLIG